MSSVQFLIGKTLSKYQVIEHLGHGGMAEVYKAQQVKLDRLVALKVLHPFLAEEEGFVARFEREARMVATLRHPNIVQVYDFDHSAEYDVYYMVMEFIDGLTLKSRLQEGTLLPDEAARITASIADALDYAHRRGMVHRDIKPANIMFTAEGQPVLTDFGIARMVSLSGLTASGAMVGTPAYMAPEVGMGQAGTAASDIYSLGVVLYQLSTGRLPFDCETPMGLVMQHINDPVPPPSKIAPQISTNLENVILKALAKKPEERYNTAGEMAQVLRGALGMEMIPGLTTTSSLPAAGSEAALTTAAGMATTSISTITIRPDPEQARDLSGDDEVPERTWPPPVSEDILPAEPPAEPRRNGWRTVAWMVVGIGLILGVGGWAVTSGTAPGLAGLLNLPTNQISPPLGTPTAPGTALTPPSNVITEVLAPTGTVTLVPTATAVTRCSDRMRVDEVRIVPSGEGVAPGSVLVAYLTLRNAGNCAWPEDGRLSLAGGERMGAPENLFVASVLPGQTTQVLLPLYAPGEPGEYNAIWEVSRADGRVFGGPIALKLVVADLPTATPLPGADRPATPAPADPLVVEAPRLVAWQEDPTMGTWSATLEVVVTGGAGRYEVYRGVVQADTIVKEGRLEVQGQYCRPTPLTLWVLSGEQMERWEGAIPYPASERCGGQ